MPIGAAMSTDVSGSIGNISSEMSPRPSMACTPNSPSNIHSIPPANPTLNVQVSSGQEKSPGAWQPKRNLLHPGPPSAIRTHFTTSSHQRRRSSELSMLYILHPDYDNVIVAEGRAGGSWKSPSAKFGSLCTEGQQMVQIHKVIKTGVPLIFLEDRQPFRILDDTLVKPSGSSVCVKWQSILTKKSKPKKTSGSKGV
ncbi:hypothetical protein KC19_VG112900 [Ceratodon purpureus]|uniref:Uncharacterized protein n=1 Tax=Ceratodon purpureus TaxID=3225 RepID=A0A8T0HPC6_CERPU|nr:hypothetical protein KC19_VG112900 [Ceratodon purpureus]